MKKEKLIKENRWRAAIESVACTVSTVAGTSRVDAENISHYGIVWFTRLKGWEKSNKKQDPVQADSSANETPPLV